MASKRWSRPIDFFARRSHYVDHMAPIWHALDDSVRGTFYVPELLYSHAEKLGVEPVPLQPPGVNNKLDVSPPGDGPVVTSGYMDLQAALRRDPRRPQIFMQHGVGLTFHHNAYAGGSGMQRDVSLFLDPNQHTRDLVAKRFPHKPGFVIGTPKLDAWFNREPSERKKEGKPVVCISFHWDGSAIAPEAGNALRHYAEILPVLAKQEEFTLIGHGHPRVMGGLAPYFQSVGIEPVWDFQEVMERADLYVNDCSSTMYEFLVTGKPVVILNAPWFRRNVYTGIRFWKYTDIGPQVDEPHQLVDAIIGQLEDSEQYRDAREKAVQDLYPYPGEAAKRAASVIQEFVEAKGPVVHKIDQVDGESIGILYMGFGLKAAKEIRKSMASLRNVGLKIPVCVVGDTPVKGAQFVEWPGQSPFDPAQRQNFQFRAGRIKPFLVGLTPFQRTLYLDADTEFMSDIMAGFHLLGEHDMALAEELLSLGQLYNKERAGWEINIRERDETIAELGGNPKRKFLNSGVIFFRKNDRINRLFEAWYCQWMRYQQWDEQLALMRALHQCPDVKYKALSPDWNHPHRHKAKIIFHNYGRGVARINVSTGVMHGQNQ